jgi:hypothetical protein
MPGGSSLVALSHEVITPKLSCSGCDDLRAPPEDEDHASKDHASRYGIQRSCVARGSNQRPVLKGTTSTVASSVGDSAMARAGGPWVALAAREVRLPLLARFSTFLDRSDEPADLDDAGAAT